MDSFIIEQTFDEKTVGVEKSNSFGRLLNPHYLIPQIESFHNQETTTDIRDIPDGPMNGDSIDGVNGISNKPGYDSIQASNDSGYTDHEESSSSSDSSSSSSSASLSDFNDSGHGHSKVKRQKLKIKKQKDFNLTVASIPILKVTAVKSRLKYQTNMCYIVTGVYTTGKLENFTDVVRVHDKITTVNGVHLEEHKFDIRKYLSFDNLTDSSFTVKLEVKRWERCSEVPNNYLVKKFNIEYNFQKPSLSTLANSQDVIVKEQSVLLHTSQERHFRNLRWTGKKRQIVLRMDEFNEMFVFLDEDERLLIGPMNKTETVFYHFFVRPFVCLVEFEGKHEQREGVTITYRHGNLSLDITSRLQHGEKEVAVQDHSHYDIKKPDERFFLKHVDTDGSQRYESLCFQYMCFKFEKSTKYFVMSKYHEASKSVDYYLFQTFSVEEGITTMMCPEGPVCIPTEDDAEERKTDHFLSDVTLALEPEIRDSGEVLASRTTVIGAVSGITRHENNSIHKTGIKLASDSEIGITLPEIETLRLKKEINNTSAKGGHLVVTKPENEQKVESVDICAQCQKISGITRHENNSIHKTGIKLASDSEIGITLPEIETLRLKKEINNTSAKGGHLVVTKPENEQKVESVDICAQCQKRFSSRHNKNNRKHFFKTIKTFLCCSIAQIESDTCAHKRPFNVRNHRNISSSSNHETQLDDANPENVHVKKSEEDVNDKCFENVNEKSDSKPFCREDKESCFNERDGENAPVCDNGLNVLNESCVNERDSENALVFGDDEKVLKYFKRIQKA